MTKEQIEKCETINKKKKLIDEFRAAEESLRNMPGRAEINSSQDVDLDVLSMYIKVMYQTNCDFRKFANEKISELEEKYKKMIEEI